MALQEYNQLRYIASYACIVGLKELIMANYKTGLIMMCSDIDVLQGSILVLTYIAIPFQICK